MRLIHLPGSLLTAFLVLAGPRLFLEVVLADPHEVPVRAASSPVVPGASPQARRTHAGRAAAELFFVNTVGIGSYFAREGANRVDWEYQPTARDFGRKITDGWAFDSNTFGVNFLGHTYSGVFYYQVGRSNGYGPFASFLHAFSGSLMWEYIGEYRERVSANDMIFTPVGGTLVGEAFHQVSLGAERSRLPRATRGVLAFVFDPFRKINEWWDRKRPPARRRTPSVIAEAPPSEETL